MRIFKALDWYFRREWRRYLLAISALAVVAGLVLVPARVAGNLVDQMVAGTLTTHDLWWTGLGLAGLALVIYGLRVVWRVMLFGASLQLAAELREQLFEKLSSLNPDFYQRFATGDLMARTTSDVEAVQMTAGEGVLALVDGLMTGVVVLGVMMTLISWELTLATLAPWPIMAWQFRRIGLRLHAGFDAAQTRLGELTAQAQQALGGIRTVRAFRLEALETERFASHARATSDASLAVARAESAYDPVIVLTIGSSFLLAIAYGSVLIQRDALTLGELTSFTLYMGFLIWPMFAYGWLLNIVEKGAVGYQRIREVLDATPAVADTGTSIPDASATLDIDIREFRFDGASSPALEQLHLTLHRGQTLGLVGPIGGGKSTLINLLLRHYPLTNGSIRLGGCPIESLRLAALRRHFAVVPQEPVLFSGTIADNIRLGRPDASEAALRDVARLAAVDTDIARFPDGYETVVGERGVTLSGGQKQRIAIARALLSEAPCLILDDALSAVDVDTERRILAHLREARPDTTTIVAGHRLSAVVHADEIVVLRDGRSIERGTHADLCAAGGWYRQTWDYQQLERLVHEGR